MAQPDFDEEYWNQIIDQLLQEIDNENPIQTLKDTDTTDPILIKNSILYLNNQIEKIKLFLQIS